MKIASALCGHRLGLHVQRVILDFFEHIAFDVERETLP
ncbi:MAG: hypothetical protein KatS3mg110_2389 [Pirellulaceae bacterium]|nr:MAG: hypothetical protein KatS3mg110_2389 [Pirellulaceae bacterium]